MKRMPAKQRRFGPGEFASLAEQCVNVIIKGQNVLDFLANKGAQDPANEWYDIRRWIKSNRPEIYSQIPMAFRLEIPVQRVNPDYKPPTETAVLQNKDGSTSTIKLYGDSEKKPEAEEAKEMIQEQPKRRPGRQPKAKEGEMVAEENKPRKAPQKAKAKVVINEVQGQKLTYTRHENGTIFIHVPGFSDNLTLRIDEIRTMMSELPEVVKILGK